MYSIVLLFIDFSITILLLFLTIFNFLPQKYQVLNTIQRGAEQSKNVHGMKDKDFTPEFMQKVRGLIRRLIRTSYNSGFVIVWYEYCLTACGFVWTF